MAEQSTLTQYDPDNFADWLRTQHPGHGTVKATVLHHTWSPNASQYVGRSTIEGIKEYHMEVRGWSDIGANAYACPDGTVFTARPLSNSNWAHAQISKYPPESEAGAISGGDSGWFNKYAFGLETVANFDEEDPYGTGLGGKSFECALRVLTAVHKFYNLPESKLFFHRDVADKSCPGNKLSRSSVRAELGRRLSQVAVDVDEWAEESVERAIAEGLMSRDENGLFHGRDACSRQEQAIVIIRLLDKVRAECRKVPLTSTTR